MKRALFLFLLIPFLAAQTTTEVEITAEPSHHLAVENEYIRAFKVEVAPHTATLMHRHRPVSYTHLDVYKRQGLCAHAHGQGRYDLI